MSSDDPTKPHTRLKPYFGMTPERYREWLLSLPEEPDVMFLAISPEWYEKLKDDRTYGPLLSDQVKIDSNQS